MFRPRLVRLVSKNDAMRQLLWTFGKSFRALPYVALLIALVLFVYGVVGMQLFGRVALADDRAINSHANFRTFPAALLTLMRVATGEGWQQLMRSAMLSSPTQCSTTGDDGQGSTCGSAAAVPYFVSFVLLVSFLVVNLFVAVIMDNFDYLTQDSAILGAHHLPRFVEVRQFCAARA